MKSGIIFDIKELALHDGPGIRTTVFLKGCPLRCRWCHNPEGLSSEPQMIKSPAGPRLAGKKYTSQELAAVLNRQADVLRSNDGGVTFSGGEPLMQAAFVAEVIDRLDNLDVLLDTSGFASEGDFRLVAEKSDIIFFDIKLIDADAHRRWTDADNTCILRNLGTLSTMGIRYVIRLPLVPGLTDTTENLSAIAETVKGLPGLVRVDLLPYNKIAGGKYKSCNMDFCPGFDETKEVNADVKIFEAAGLPVKIV